MNPTPEQLAQLQADVDALKAAVAADTTALQAVSDDQAALLAAQTTLAAAQAVQVGTSQTVVTAENDLFAFVQQLLNPPTP